MDVWLGTCGFVDRGYGGGGEDYDGDVLGDGRFAVVGEEVLGLAERIFCRGVLGKGSVVGAEGSGCY